MYRRSFFLSLDYSKKPQGRNLKCQIFKIVLHWCLDLICHNIGTPLKHTIKSHVGIWYALTCKQHGRGFQNMLIDPSTSLWHLNQVFQIDFVYCHSRYAVIYLYQTTCLIRCLSEWYVVSYLYLYLSFVRGYIKEVRTVQEQEGSTEDIIIHRRNLRGGYKAENTNNSKSIQNSRKR
jgi:hypothetical protein